VQPSKKNSFKAFSFPSLASFHLWTEWRLACAFASALRCACVACAGLTGPAAQDCLRLYAVPCFVAGLAICFRVGVLELFHCALV